MLRNARRSNRQRASKPVDEGNHSSIDCQDGGSVMNEQLIALFTYFVLAIFIGFEVISKVPTILHTPLMSGTNAIHGVILVGALLIAASVRTPMEIVIGLL